MIEVLTEIQPNRMDIENFINQNNSKSKNKNKSKQKA